MGDFLRAEWKTLLIASIIAGAMWSFFSYEGDVQQVPPPPEATVVPNERIGDIRVGAPVVKVAEAMGEPDEKDTLELGTEVWRYTDDGIRLFVVDGVIRSVGRELRQGKGPDVWQPIAPNGRDIRSWSSQRTIEGPELGRMESDGRVYLRFEGFMVEFAADDRVGKPLVVYAIDDQVETSTESR